MAEMKDSGTFISLMTSWSEVLFSKIHRICSVLIHKPNTWQYFNGQFCGGRLVFFVVVFYKTKDSLNVLLCSYLRQPACVLQILVKFLYLKSTWDMRN